MGKAPGASVGVDSFQDAAFNKWLSLTNRAEAVDSKTGTVEAMTE